MPEAMPKEWRRVPGGRWAHCFGEDELVSNCGQATRDSATESFTEVNPLPGALCPRCRALDRRNQRLAGRAEQEG